MHAAPAHVTLAAAQLVLTWHASGSPSCALSCAERLTLDDQLVATKKALHLPLDRSTTPLLVPGLRSAIRAIRRDGHAYLLTDAMTCVMLTFPGFEFQ